jgi:hypothetical protein
MMMMQWLGGCEPAYLATETMTSLLEINTTKHNLPGLVVSDVSGGGPGTGILYLILHRFFRTSELT